MGIVLIPASALLLVAFIAVLNAGLGHSQRADALQVEVDELDLRLVDCSDSNDSAIAAYVAMTSAADRYFETISNVSANDYSAASNTLADATYWYDIALDDAQGIDERTC